ncbi:MAG: class I SAM-dependent methyltransferase [Egibacteraceae bacterium]
MAALLRPSTVALLESMVIGPGDRCLDVGCGGGHVTMELARLVGSSGHVVGVDLDAEILQLARRDAEVAGLGNIDFRLGDATQLEEGGYDVVYTRFVLGHLSRPEAVVHRMTACLRPGGVLVVEDFDLDGGFADPPSSAHERWCQATEEVVRRRGGDPSFARRLPNALRRAGLVGVGVGVAQPAFMEGPGKALLYLGLEDCADVALAEGVLSEEEVERLHAELVAFAEDPETLLSTPRRTPRHKYAGIRASLHPRSPRCASLP